MRHIVSGLIRLALLYAALAVAGEVVLDCASSPPSEWLQAALAALTRTAQAACAGRAGEVRLVAGSLWVFRNKVHYLILLLVGLAGYYSYRDKTLPRPDIARTTPRPFHSARSEEHTQREVEKLTNSEEYREYQRRKSEGHLQEDGQEEEEDETDWEAAEQQIFDD